MSVHAENRQENMDPAGPQQSRSEYNTAGSNINEAAFRATGPSAIGSGALFDSDVGNTAVSISPLSLLKPRPESFPCNLPVLYIVGSIFNIEPNVNNISSSISLSLREISFKYVDRIQAASGKGLTGSGDSYNAVVLDLAACRWHAVRYAKH